MVATSWSPVPAAATTPTGPRRTRLANPSAAPPMIAVPQSGPMQSRPASRPIRLSRTSSSIGTLSLNSITWSPASSASRATPAANLPGTEMSARLASGSRRAAAATVRGR